MIVGIHAVSFNIFLHYRVISHGKVDCEVVSDLLTQLGTISCGESLAAEENSAFNFADAILAAETGAFYPNGSFPALEQAFHQTIRAADGVIFQNVDVSLPYRKHIWERHCGYVD